MIVSKGEALRIRRFFSCQVVSECKCVVLVLETLTHLLLVVQLLLLEYKTMSCSVCGLKYMSGLNESHQQDYCVTKKYEEKEKGKLQ